MRTKGFSWVMDENMGNLLGFVWELDGNKKNRLRT
jgi:hypothetical protein